MPTVKVLSWTKRRLCDSSALQRHRGKQMQLQRCSNWACDCAACVRSSSSCGEGMRWGQAALPKHSASHAFLAPPALRACVT